MVICDTQRSCLETFQTEMKGSGSIRVVENGYQAVQEAVSSPPMELCQFSMSNLICVCPVV